MVPEDCIMNAGSLYPFISTGLEQKEKSFSYFIIVCNYPCTENIRYIKEKIAPMHT